jgi:phosphatidylinositol alpha-1,6-mannosyltransferase
LDEFGPHLILATSWRPVAGVLDAVLASRAEARPAVAAFAGSELGEKLSGSAKKECKEVFKAGVRWFCFSDQATRLLVRRGVPMDRAFRVPPGVAGPESPPDRGMRTRPRRLLTVAPLVPPAGQDKVIQALSLLATERPRLKYEIVGEGPDEARLRGLAESLGLAERVVFRGRLEGTALEHAYSRADIFVLPGRRTKGTDPEPDFATLWLEAAARGLPILASGGGDDGAGLKDGVNAKIVGRPSDAGAVSEALDDLIRFPLALTGLGRAARRHFEATGRPSLLGKAVLDISAGWYQA